MQKYKLKRELPFAKVGDEVFISSGAFVVKDPYQLGQVLYIEDYKNKEKLITEGWIEEVKPREWYIGLTKNDLPCYVGEGKPYEDRIHYNFMSSINNEFELIKVREVLE